MTRPIMSLKLRLGPAAKRGRLACIAACVVAVMVAGCGNSVEGPGSYSHATDAQFCSTHQCIPYFPNGRGAIAQCVDGEWSHSGGIQGACSYHSGVRHG
jgi:hypothetical protein